jgi:hypothetical protein
MRQLSCEPTKAGFCIFKLSKFDIRLNLVAISGYDRALGSVLQQVGFGY